jgi:hypothetical protein
MNSALFFFLSPLTDLSRQQQLCDIMSTAITSIFRQIKSAITSTKNNPKEAITPADFQSIASSSGYLTPSVTSEMTVPSRGHSFVVVPGASQDSLLLTVDVSTIQKDDSKSS